MNKKIIKKATIVAVVITIFSLLITFWLDYKKDKDYEAVKDSMIQTSGKSTRDVSLVKFEVDKETVTSKGLTVIITDYNEEPFGWGPGYEVLKLVNEEQWIPVESKVPMIFNEIAYLLDENKQWEYKIDWTNFYGELEPGKYRLKKTVYDSGNTDIYSDIFEIK